MRDKLETLALVLGFIGLFGTITITALPMWRVSAFIGANIVVMEDLWEGLWMNCWRQANVRMQCKMYDSLLILPPELQAARGLMCVSIVLVVIALLITGCGTRMFTCCGDNIRSKNITLALGGCVYLLSFLTTIIPVSWVGLTIIRNFYSPLVMEGRKRELGSAIFIGWATCGVLLITGIIILVSYSKHRAKDEDPYYTVPLGPLRKPSTEGSAYLNRTGSPRKPSTEGSDYLNRTGSPRKPSIEGSDYLNRTGSPRKPSTEGSDYVKRTLSSSRQHHEYV